MFLIIKNIDSLKNIKINYFLIAFNFLKKLKINIIATNKKFSKTFIIDKNKINVKWIFY